MHRLNQRAAAPLSGTACGILRFGHGFQPRSHTASRSVARLHGRAATLLRHRRRKISAACEPNKTPGSVVVRPTGDQAAKPGIPIDLKQTAETFQIGYRMLALTIFTIGVPRRQDDRSDQGRLSTRSTTAVRSWCRRGLDPDRQGCVVGNHLWRGQNRAQDQLM